VLDVLTRALASVPAEYVARAQAPVRLTEDTELEPDILIATGPRERYDRRHPGPEDILLIVEVSVSSLGFDAGEKLRVYARRSLPQVWVIDANRRQIVAYSSPEPDRGTYASAEIHSTGTLAAFGLEVTLDGLWPAEA
jgi:Uma2 family endonuclease